MVKVSKQSTVITSHSKELRLPANVHKEDRTTNLSILKFKHLTLLNVLKMVRLTRFSNYDLS